MENNLKPIQWSEPLPPNGETCFYDHCIGTTPLGNYSIEWKSWKEYDAYIVYFDGEYIDSGIDLDDAKTKAEKHYHDKIMSCFDIRDEKLDLVVNIVQDAHMLATGGLLEVEDADAIGRHIIEKFSDDIGWKEAIDHELSSIHYTIDSFATPKDALKTLIEWHVSVATDSKLD